MPRIYIDGVWHDIDEDRFFSYDSTNETNDFRRYYLGKDMPHVQHHTAQGPPRPLLRIAPAERMDEPIRVTVTSYPTVPCDEPEPAVEPELPVGGGLGISWEKALERIDARDEFMGQVAREHAPVDFLIYGKVYRPDCSCSKGGDSSFSWHHCETAMIALRSVGLDVNDIDFQPGDARDGQAGGAV